jgi:hypothetical protein
VKNAPQVKHKQNHAPASDKTKSNLLVTENVPGKMEIEF